VIDNRIPILLDRIATRDLKLANLFQFQPYGSTEWLWQANLTDGIKVWEFGRGGSAAAALEAAIAAVAKPSIPRRATAKIVPFQSRGALPLSPHPVIILDDEELML